MEDRTPEWNDDADEIKIIRNAPLPKRQARTKYPFKELAVNDAFFVPTDNPKGRQSSVYAAAKRVVPDMKFSIRTVPGGIQVHRVE